MARGRVERVLAAAATGARRPVDLVVEEPLEVHLGDRHVATLLRTPGHDYELAVGHLLGLGLLAEAPVERVRYCATGSAVETNFNVVSVEVARPALPAIEAEGPPSAAALVASLVGRFGAVASADVPAEPSLPAPNAAAAGDVVRDDVHPAHAVAKVVGRLALDGRLPADGLVLAVGAAVDLDLLRPAWAAGFGAVVGAGRPTALAARAAAAAGMTLVAVLGPGEVEILRP